MFCECPKNAMIPKSLICLVLCCASPLMADVSHAQSATEEAKPAGFRIPHAWTRRGLILPRENQQGFGVSGDPCIVWDAAIKGWRMVFFHDPSGHAQAVCLDAND